MRISEIFKNDSFIPSSSVFPEIDKDRLVRELEIKKKGRERGASGQPSSDAKTLDHVELEIISKVDGLRRRGLENFETNRAVYSERLNRASLAQTQVETEANDAKSKFMEETVRWRSMMVEPRERVQETYNWRKRFREIHKLERPARRASSLVSVIGLAFVMIMLESAGNAYLFAQKNTLGLLGGLMAAFLVSVGNVAVSTVLGMASRYVNIQGVLRLPIKVLGLAFALLWIAFAAGYNLAVAHFRDAVETVGDWQEAGQTAVRTLLANPINLQTMESYVLVILGAVISLVAFLKGYHSSDPYPGYSRVQADVTLAREDYIAHLEEAIERLAENRDDAVELLKAASDEVQRNITDSIDALYGQRTLISGVAPFLEQCDIAANYLLAVYRDANRAGRSPEDPAPEYFAEKFAFGTFEPATVEEVRRADAETRLKEIEELVSTSIRDIFDVFERAVHDHYEIDELEGVYSDRAKILASNRKGRSEAGELQVITGRKVTG